MYKITVKKVVFYNNKKTFLNIDTCLIDIKNLTPKILELKQIYKDFNYIIDFNKI